MAITVVNRHTDPGGVLVARPHILGNPYTFHQDRPTRAAFVVGSRDEAVQAYRRWLWERMQSDTPERRAIAELAEQAKRGDLVLACWCVPRNCHAFVVKRAIEWWIKIEQGAKRMESQIPHGITIQIVQTQSDGVHIQLAGTVPENHGWSNTDLAGIFHWAGYAARVDDDVLILGYQGEDYHIQPASVLRRVSYPLAIAIAIVADIREGRWASAGESADAKPTENRVVSPPRRP